MKKIILTSLIAAAAAVPAIAGVDNINYQAVIKNGNDVVAGKEVAMKFELVDKSEKVVYSEEQNQKTNASGFVSCQLGKDDALSTIKWGDLTLRVSIDLGSGFEVISNEAVSSVPTALYSLRSADSDEIKAQIAEISDFHERVNETLINLNEFKDDVEANLQAVNDEIAKLQGLNPEEINDYLQRISEALVNLNEFQEDADKALQEVSDALRDLQGLNAEEINDFHKRVSEEITNINEHIESNDEFNQSVSDELAKLQGLDAEEINDFHKRVNEELININEQIASNDEFNQTVSDELAKLQGLSYEEEADFKQRLTEEIVDLRNEIESLKAEIAALKAAK